MKAIKYLLWLLAIPAFANFPAQIAVKLAAGKFNYTLTNSGSSGGTYARVAGVPASWARIAVVATPGVFVPPTTSTTYTDCADPCGTGGTASLMTLNMQWGKTYIWYVRLDSGGTPVSPFQYSAVGASYSAQSCDSVGGIAMVEPPVTTTSPLPMPREVIGQDCYVDLTQLSLLSGHASSGVQWWIRIHAPIYKTLAQADNKFSLKINSGSWINLTNANAASSTSWSSGKNHRLDEAKYYSCNDKNQFEIDSECALLNFGGYTQIADYLIDIPNSTIGSGDTTVTQRFRFNGTEGIGSGGRLIEAFPVEGTGCTITQIVVTSGVPEATCSGAHGYSTNDDVLIWGAPMERRIFNGPHHHITVTSSTKFTFTPCEPATGASSAFSTGGSKAVYCTIADGTYKPPVNADPIARKTTEQAYMYARKMLVAATSFTYADPATEAAPGAGDPVEGKCLFETSNACAGGSNVLVLPVTPLTGYVSTVNCVDCHAKGPSGFAGSDLKYYNFSNHTIEQRSYFHGLSQQNGLDIAAYIRGIPIPVPAQARPWNPPMQTGPGMAAGTFKRSDSTLTSIVVSGSNLATVTTAGAHGYSTGMWITTILSTAGVVNTVSATKTITKTSGEDFPASVVAGTVINILGSLCTTACIVASRTSGTVLVLSNDPGDFTGLQYRTNPAIGGHVNTITVTGSTTFTYPTSGIANGTYTDTLLLVTNAHEFLAGCGIDCVSTYGVPQDMYPSMSAVSGSANWGQAGFLDPRTVVYPYIFPDWNLAWLPAIHPNDSAPSANYFSSTPYSYLQTLYGATPGDLTSWASLNYGLSAGSGQHHYWDLFQGWWGANAIQTSENPPTNTNKFEVLDTISSPGNDAPSLYSLVRQSAVNTTMMGLWTLQVNYKVTGFSVPQIKTFFGATTAAGCYPEWSLFDYYATFNRGDHKTVMGVNNALQGNLSSFMYASHIWYVATLGIGYRQCWDTPNDPIDLSYGLAFTNNITLYRAAPVATYLIWPIFSSQAGHANANAYKNNNPINFGWDWLGSLYNPYFGNTRGNKFGIWWLTDAERATLVDHTLDIHNLSWATYSHTYWETAFTNLNDGQGTVCGGDSLCQELANYITWATLFGGNSTKIATLVTNVKSIQLTAWLAHDWDADVAAGTQGNTNLGPTGDLSTAQPMTGNNITFSSCATNDAASPYPYWVGSSGSSDYELLPGYNGTCSVVGSAGILVFFTTRPHPGTPIIYYGCRNSPALVPNFDGDGFRCTNGAQ